MSDPKPWSNKVAVVTGGASGIGEATAAQFAKGGATVIVLDRVAATSAGVISIGCDVSVSSDIGAAAARIGKESRRIAARPCAGRCRLLHNKTGRHEKRR